MHIKGNSEPAFFGWTDKLSQEKKLSKEGGLEATVTSHKIPSDSRHEGNALISLPYRNHIDLAALRTTNP